MLTLTSDISITANRNEKITKLCIKIMDKAERFLYKCVNKTIVWDKEELTAESGCVTNNTIAK